MSIATEIQSIRQLIDRFAESGSAGAADLVRQMRGLADHPDGKAVTELVAVCQATAASIESLLGAEQLAAAMAPVEKHLREVIDYAEAWSASIDGDGAPVTKLAPEPLAVESDGVDQQYAETVGMFVSNALTAVSDLEEELLSVESVGESLEDTLSSIRRTVHTLKAEFGVLNMLSPQKLCHQAETMIDAVVEHGAAFPVDLMLQFGDQIKQYLERLAADVHAQFGDPEPMLKQFCDIEQAAADTPADGDEPVDLGVGGDFADSLPDFISEARSHLADAEVAIVELSRDSGNGENLNLTFRAFHTIKGVAGFLNLSSVVELAHVAETLLDGARSSRFQFEAEDIDVVLAACDMITQMISAMEGGPAPTMSEWRKLICDIKSRSEADRSGAGSEPAVAAPAEAAPAAPATSPEASTTPAQPPVGDSVAKGAPAPKTEAKKPEVIVPPKAAAPKKKSGATQAARVERTIKVSTTRLDMLVDMVGELVIAQSMVAQDPTIQNLESQALARNIGQVGKITRDLQEAAMSLRMVTVKATFQKMARLVRDVAGKSGKKVNLSLAGEDTELDRNVVEQISDPLVHMIRNAIDHGIESPDARLDAGKDAEGELTLSAYHQGGSIVIEIQDDGRGLDRNKVFEKAVNKGLIPEGTSQASLSDMEIFNMIFLPGFSTAEKVTDLSGRGVGMDVVRRNIEALRGKIEIESTLGEGTTFRLRLPLTLAIIDGMIVRVGKSRYVVPTLSIEQSFRPSTDDVHYVVDRGECVHVRGAVLPIYRLKEVFDQQDGCDELGDGILIVVEVDGQRSCLFVDEIVGQQQVVIKSLGMSRDRITGLSGGAIMTDGRVALIVDVGTLVESILTS